MVQVLLMAYDRQGAYALDLVKAMPVAGWAACSVSRCHGVCMGAAARRASTAIAERAARALPRRAAAPRCAPWKPADVQLVLDEVSARWMLQHKCGQGECGQRLLRRRGGRHQTRQPAAAERAACNSAALIRRTHVKLQRASRVSTSTVRLPSTTVVSSGLSKGSA